MNASAVIFAHPPDYLGASYAARALRQHGIPVTVAVDRKDPLPVIEGCRVIATRFARNGNLNGKACVEGILATMDAVGRRDDEWVLKVDADAVNRRMDWLRKIPGDIDLAGLCHPAIQEMFGFTYAIRRSSLPGFRQRAASLPASQDCPEDCTISTLAARSHLYENITPGCPMAGYAWDDYRADEWWKEQFDVLVFQRTDGRGHREVAQAMKKFQP